MENYKDFYHSFSAAGTDEDVYTVSSKRVLYITDIVATNKESAAILITLKDDTDTKMEIKVDANNTKAIKLNSPMRFISSIKAQVDSFTNGSSIVLTGYEL